jgi:hypothetical protein
LLNFFVVEIVCPLVGFGRKVVVVGVQGLLKMVNGVTFGLVNVGCDLFASGGGLSKCKTIWVKLIKGC